MPGSTGDHHSGIAMVKFGDINNYTETYNLSNAQFYADYSNNYCLGTAFTYSSKYSYRTLSVNSSDIDHPISIQSDQVISV